MGANESRSRIFRIVLGLCFILALLGVGGLLAIIGPAEIAKYCLRCLTCLAEHFWSSIAIPAGLFYLLLLGAVSAPLLVAWNVYRRYLGKEQVWRQYRMDTFFWAEWQWDYNWKGQITKLWCECEKCAEPMKPKVVPDGADDVGVRFICNRCGKQSTTIRSAESKEDALEMVEKKILRKIRVGKYRGAIEGKTLAGEGGEAGT